MHQRSLLVGRLAVHDNDEKLGGMVLDSCVVIENFENREINYSKRILVNAFRIWDWERRKQGKRLYLVDYLLPP